MKVATQFEIENRNRPNPLLVVVAVFFLPRIQHLSLDYSTVVEHEGNPCITRHEPREISQQPPKDG